MQERLKGKGALAGCLKQELDFFDTVSLDDDVIWFRSALSDFLQVWRAREEAVEKALEDCLINLQISDDRMSKSDFCADDVVF